MLEKFERGLDLHGAVRALMHNMFHPLLELVVSTHVGFC